jgi:hypothetical protein
MLNVVIASEMMVDQDKMDNNMMDMENKNDEEDMVIDNNMNSYFFEIKNK